LWFLGLVYTLTKGKLVRFTGTELVALDLLTIVTAYTFLIYGQTGSCLFALSQGFFIDLFSGEMHGLFTFLYICIFGGIWLGSRFFNLQTPKGQIFIVSLVMLTKNVIFIIMVAAFSQEFFFPRSFFWFSGALLIFTGLSAPVLFFVFDRLRDVLSEEKGKSPTEPL